MTARILNHHHDRLTRRSIFVGAAVSLLYAPAIVRATSLMPVHGVILPTERPLPFGCQYAGFCERLMYQNLDDNLRAGRMGTVLNGKMIPETDARRVVAYARAQGWLAPEATW
jgi:hypothetical protein